MTLDQISTMVRRDGLDVLGAFRTKPEDELGPGTMLMLGPDGQNFWPKFKTSPEYHDGTPDPVDRWSLRTITDIANSLSGRAYFPFQGPPYSPFFGWALRTGRAWKSPVQMLVHDTGGLWVSYRGAIMIDALLIDGTTHASPCDTCDDKPCLTSCPIGALDANGYDVPACHGFLDQLEGKTCMTEGCSVRASCPVSAAFGRLSEQSAFHMKVFHK